MNKRAGTTLFGFIAVLIATSSCAGSRGDDPSPSPAPLQVRGTISTNLHMGMYGSAQGASCSHSPGFSTVAVGDPVQVSDDQGRTLALGRVEAGHINGGRCVLQFNVQVPRGPQFYNLKVGSLPTQPYRADELATELSFWDPGRSLLPD